MYGSHSFRIRSISLGSDGNFQEWVIVEVDQLTYDKYNWGVALAFIVIFLVIIITTVYNKCKTYRSSRTSDHDHEYLLPRRMDSDIVEEHIEITGSPQQIQPVVRHPSTPPPTEREQRQQRRPLLPISEDSQMELMFFKSNTTLDQPTTSSHATTSSSGIHIPETTSQSSRSFARRILSPVQGTPRNDRAGSSEMEDSLLSRSPETQNHSTDESDYE